jgi:hypothetical protein
MCGRTVLGAEKKRGIFDLSWESNHLSTNILLI